jgi:23S rRNA U2552 (ribose-2'-O)-methylase RlmE/FtsJ
VSSLTIEQDLCAAALQFSYDCLKVGGHFVCKFYQGSEDKDLEMQLKKLFTSVYRDKPDSSRSVGWLSTIVANRADCSRSQRRLILWPCDVENI